MSIIYKTTCLINNKIYIGQHCTDAEDGYLGSGDLIKKAILKYGKHNFKREILEECDCIIINEREIYWIDKLNSRDKNIGYNLAIGGDKPLQHPFSQEHKQKLSLARRGKCLSEITKQRISNSNKGKIRSQESRLKISQASKGKYISLETRKNMSEAHKNKPSNRKGTINSDETKKKMSNSMKIAWDKKKNNKL